MKKPRGSSRQVLEALKPYQPQRVIIFGSRARGDSRRFSDIDLVLIKDTPEKFLDRMRAVAQLLRPLPGEKDVFVYTPQEWQKMIAEGNPFVEEVLREGVALYGEPLEKIVFSEARMEGRKQVAQRWLLRAEDDLRRARAMQERGFADSACFFSQQAAEKALKALLYAQGERAIRHHSVSQLCQDLTPTYPKFGALAHLGERLDAYYFVTRYPDHKYYRPPEDFPLGEGEEAVRIAEQIVEEAKKSLGKP